MNKKVADVKKNYKRYSSEVDIASKQRYSQDIKEYEERIILRKEREQAAEKQSYQAFLNSQNEKRNASPGSSVGSYDYDDSQMRLSLIDNRLTDA